jgi:hypothetical protein
MSGNPMSWRHLPLIRLARRFASDKPAIFFPFARLAGNTRLLDAQTELVVDGYPRSANSFTEAAFAYSQAQRGIRLATHVHSAAQIIRAVECGIPAVVLLRQPDQAVASMIQMTGMMDADLHFRDYCAFYRPLRGLGDGFVTVEFSQVFGRFDELVMAVNEHFGTDLSVPQMGEAFDRGVEEMRDTVSLERVGRTPNYSARQGQGELDLRKDRQDDLLAQVSARDDLASRREALALFEDFRARAEIA